MQFQPIVRPTFQVAVGVTVGISAAFGLVHGDPSTIVALISSVAGAFAGFLATALTIMVGLNGSTTGLWYLRAGAIPPLVKRINNALLASIGLAATGVVVLLFVGLDPEIIGWRLYVFAAWLGAAAWALMAISLTMRALGHLVVEQVTDMETAAKSTDRVDHVLKKTIIAALEEHERNVKDEADYEAQASDQED